MREQKCKTKEEISIASYMKLTERSAIWAVQAVDHLHEHEFSVTMVLISLMGKNGPQGPQPVSFGLARQE